MNNEMKKKCTSLNVHTNVSKFAITDDDNNNGSGNGDNDGKSKYRLFFFWGRKEK